MILKPPEKTGQLQQLEVMVQRYLQPPQDVTEAHGRASCNFIYYHNY
ncbi:hypothetical protein ACTNEO_18340 [Gracilibacillus sp. HCP3S3_G5_1]